MQHCPGLNLKNNILFKSIYDLDTIEFDQDLWMMKLKVRLCNKSDFRTKINPFLCNQKWTDFCYFFSDDNAVLSEQDSFVRAY